MHALPTEIRAGSSWRDVWREVALTVALVVAINALVDRYLDIHPTNRAKAVVQAKWDLVRAPPKDLGWLVVGDSSANQGVDTRMLAAATHEAAINVATVGDFGVVGDAWMLQALLAAGGHPKRIVMVHVADVWVRGLEVLERVVTRLRPPVDVARFEPPLAWSMRQKLHLAWNHHFVNRFPFYTQNDSLTWLLLNPGKILHPPQVRLDPSGFESEPETSPELFAQDTPNLRKFMKGSSAELTAHQLAALETVARLTRRLHATLYIRPSPLWEGFAGDPAVQPFVNHVADQLEHFAATHASVVLLTRDPFWLPATQLQNADHATEEGARRFTQSTLDEILHRERRAP